MNSDHPDSICPLCFPDHEYLGSIGCWFHLMRWNDQLHLIEEPAHRDHILFSFNEDPVAEQEEWTYEEFDEWMAKMDAIDFGCHPNAGYRIITRCIEAGYNPAEDGFYNYWIYGEVGKWLDDKKN